MTRNADANAAEKGAAPNAANVNTLDSLAHTSTWHAAKQWLRRYRPHLFFASACLVLTLLLVLSLGQPSEPAARRAQAFVHIGFTALAFLWVTIGVFRFLTSSHAVIDLLELARIWAWRIGLYLGAVSLISWFGDAAVRWGRAHPEEGMAALVSGLLLAVVVLAEHALIFPSRFSDEAPSVKAPTLGQGQLLPRPSQRRWKEEAGMTAAPVPTERDLRHAAVHEAGHALLCAALDPLPAGISVVLVEAPIWERGFLSLGGLSGLPTGDLLASSVFARWYMMLLLSGRAAEEALFTEATLGSEHDNEEWTRMATKYLANRPEASCPEGARFSEGFFFANPKSAAEAEYNAKRLGALWVAQREEVGAFLDANSQVLEELAEVIRARGRVGREELAPFLSQVTPTEGFPAPVLLD